MARVLMVIGSLREKSHTRRAMALTAQKIIEFGGEVRTLDLRLTPLPLLFTENSPEEVNRVAAREDVLWADAFVLGSPDYHGSMSAPMKNFLDHFWHEFTGKLFGYIIASHEKGLTVQDHLRTIVRQCYGWSLPYGVGFNGDAQWDNASGQFEPALGERLEMLAHDLVVYGRLIHGQFQTDVAKDPRDPGFARRFRGMG